MTRSSLRAIVALASLLALGACFIVREAEVTELPRNRPTEVVSPVKVHLLDGSIVNFAEGAVVTADSIRIRSGDEPVTIHSPTLESGAVVTGVALADVAGAEVYRESTNEGLTLLYGVVVPIGGVVLFKAVFGSCPTFYSDSAGTPVLEAETFSSSIAPSIARRDVDGLRARPDASGRLRLEVRNEALETHYIDQIEVIEVEHREGERVMSAPFGHPLAVAAISPAASARDRTGRDVRGELRAADGVVFGSSDAAFAAATDADARDWIDLTLARPDADSVALVLRVRSSLLTTHLFYEHMLARPGAHAFDWLMSDMSSIATVARFGRWYGANMTLRVQTPDGAGWDDVVRLADIGPIAFRDVAVMVPVDLAEDSVRVRLYFTTDHWRIDHAAFAVAARRVPGRAISPAAIVDRGGVQRGDALEALREADDHPLVTRPGDRFYVEFETGVSGSPRSFLLGAHGYYIEWIRGDWLRRPTHTGPFDPSAVRLRDLLEEWRMRRDSLETEFYSTRVPVV